VRLRVDELNTFGEQLGRALRAPAIIGFSGDLGAGKTRFVKGLAAGLGVEVQQQLDPRIPPLQGDPVGLKQVVLNLVVNGLDAVADRPPGQRLVRVQTTFVNGSVELSVNDSGRGIMDGDLERVFEPFYTTKTEGLGMGLPICRSIVEAHSGQLSVESVPGKGATFRCVFPAGQPGAA